MKNNASTIDALTKSPLMQEYERAFSEATNLPITLRPSETWQVPLHGKRKENPFCALMAQRNQTCAACLQMQECLAKSAANGPATITCQFGLTETAVPVKVGATPVAYLQTGQVLQQRPTEAGFQRAMKSARKLGVEVDLKEARQAYFETPVVSQKKMDSITYLMRTFADLLAVKCNELAVQQANCEVPLVTKAREYIEAHHTENLSLGQVASAVHTSIFYFCKQFKKATGLHFTEFVCRVRAEKARHLLLNPNLRVSEIAYQVGFQSLTHFNRVFKKIFGESPTEYRMHLAKA